MKYKALIWIVALSSPWSLTYADHNRGFYVGSQVGLVDSDPVIGADATRSSLDLPALEMVFGYKYNGLLGLELRYGLGAGERDLSTPNANESLEYSIDNIQSIYYRPEITNSESKLYFLIGHSKVNAVEKFLVDDSVSSETDFSVSGMSYGLGAGWFVNKHVNINIEYLALVDDDDSEFDAVTIGFDYRFTGTDLKFW